MTLSDPAGDAFTLLTPFDRLVPLGEPGWHKTPPLVAAAEQARATLAATGLARVARLIADAPALRLHAWQLEAARAMREGRAARVLIADAVGLGKTVQAGLVHLALHDGPARERTLILTPAGLRDQWCAELERLFLLRPLVMDARGLRRLGATLPPSVNPWTVPGVFVAAIDFIKQPEVLAPALEARWSLVVLDEAHGLSVHTDRRRAADLVARAADHVVLLTATPHAGDPAAFAELCAVGSCGGDEPLILHRRRADVGLTASRREVVLRVRPRAEERRLHASLRLYLRRIRREGLLARQDARLASWVLLKRAASSFRALRLTLERRRRALAADGGDPAQPALPFDIEPGETQEDDVWLPGAIEAPGLHERRTEIRALDALIAEAAVLDPGDRKLRSTVRLVRRARQPVIVFTEFRDTLERLAESLPPGETVALHGGMRRRERLESLDRFTHGEARVLVATDAAGEGLNLHQRCRLVINVDIPWSPVRIEQRVGRVDRIGQPRRVHAVTVVSSGAESTLLRRLGTRRRQVSEGLAATAQPPAPQAAGDESMRAAVALVRAAARFGGRRRRRGRLPWAVLRGAARRRLALPAGVLLVFSVEAPSVNAPAVEPIAVLVELTPDGLSRIPARRLIRGCVALAAPRAVAHARPALDRCLDARERHGAVLRRRLEAALAGEPSQPPPCQPGLFDRRAMTAALRRHAAGERRRQAIAHALGRLAPMTAAAGRLELRPAAALILR